MLKSELGSVSDVAALNAEQLASLCAKVNASRPAILNELTSQEADLLGFLGAGASSAELYELMETRDLDYPLILLGSKLQSYSDPERDAFARRHGLVLPRHVQLLATLRLRRPSRVTKPTPLSVADNVTFEAFRTQIAAQNDDAGQHTLWVDREGAIHLDIVPKDLSLALYEAEIDNRMQFRYETFEQGLGYMGPSAAEDTRFIEHLLHGLQRDWAARAAGYMEVY